MIHKPIIVVFYWGVDIPSYPLTAHIFHRYFSLPVVFAQQVFKIALDFLCTILNALVEKCFPVMSLHGCIYSFICVFEFQAIGARACPISPPNIEGYCLAVAQVEQHVWFVHAEAGHGWGEGTDTDDDEYRFGNLHQLNINWAKWCIIIWISSSTNGCPKVLDAWLWKTCENAMPYLQANGPKSILFLFPRMF